MKKVMDDEVSRMLDRGRGEADDGVVRDEISKLYLRRRS